jgi:ABC-type Zn uptake system ZnuABC Zn-binding protein ZnuA
MSISSTGLYGSATIVNSDLFTDVENLKEQVTTLNTAYLQSTEEHRQDISENRQDISSNLNKINDIHNNKIPAIIQDISKNATDIIDISDNKKFHTKFTICILFCFIG